MNTFNPQALQRNGETVVSETWTHPDTCGFSPCPHKERRQAGHDQYAGEASLYHRWVISEKWSAVETIITGARLRPPLKAVKCFTSPDMLSFRNKMLHQTPLKEISQF